jgi:hypothetical protein
VINDVNGANGQALTDELVAGGDAMVRLFEPMYTSEPRQRPRLLPPASEQLDRLPEGISPVLYEMLSNAGLFPRPETPPRTPWR